MMLKCLIVLQISKKIYNFIPISITGENIKRNTYKKYSLKDYILFSNMRNNIVHYGYRSSHIVGKQRLIDLVKRAPDIIECLFKEYETLGSIIGVPAWYGERYSYSIE